MKVFIFIFITAIGSLSLSYETDNFNCRYENLKDVSAPLSGEVNRRIQEVLSRKRPVVTGKSTVEARLERIQEKVFKSGWGSLSRAQRKIAVQEIRRINRERGFESFQEVRDLWTDEQMSFLLKDTRKKEPPTLQGCDKERLYSAMRASIAPAWSGNMETWAGDQTFDKCLPEPDIYKNLSTFEGGVMSIAGLNYSVNVGGTVIGVDKLSHFMTEGFEYHDDMRSGGDIKSALRIGKDEEEGGYGWSATGVKSYGDLSANYHGSLFWGSLIDGPKPYLKCVNNEWKQVRDFDWKDYVNPTFDEAINCSEMVNARMGRKVDEAVEELQRSKNKTPLKCPLDVESCAKVATYIKSAYVRKEIIHPKCLNVNSRHNHNSNRGARSEAVE